MWPWKFSLLPDQVLDMNVFLPIYFLNRQKTFLELCLYWPQWLMFFFCNYLFYLWPCWVFVAVAQALSSCSEQRLLSSWGARTSHCSDISYGAQILGCTGFSSYGSKASCSKDLSSQNRDRTRVPCIGRRILNHWTTREVPFLMFLKIISLLK